MPETRIAPPLLVVYRALHLGDFCTGIPAYRAIARAFPRHTRLLAAPAGLTYLARRSGAFHGIIDTEPETLRPLPDLGPVDVAVDLHGRGPECHAVVLGLRPRRLIAFAHRDIAPSYGGPEWTADEHEVARWCRMLEHFGVIADRADYRLAPPPKIAHLANVSIVHPGASSPARRWPAERWARVAKYLIRRGERVVITGNAAELPIATEVAQLAGISHDAILAGKTSLAGISAVVAHARRVISGDTGIAHLAYAFGVPTTTLFGPVSPAHWGPPNSARHRVLWRGRFGDPHALTLDAGLAEIDVPAVVATLSV